MKNIDNWEESKFVYTKNGRLKASRNSKEVGISSRLFADIIAGFYERNLPKYAKGNLLDLGCGKVPLYKAYKDHVSNNTCVDWDNSMHKNEFLDMHADLNLPLELEANQFDTIILSDVLEHIKEPKLLWGEMARVIKQDGNLIMNVPFYYWLHEEPFDYYRYTKHALHAMAEEAGFEVTMIEPLGGAPEILTDITSKIIVRIPVIGKPLAIILQWLTWLIVRTKIGGTLSKASAKQFPYLYGMIAKKV